MPIQRQKPTSDALLTVEDAIALPRIAIESLGPAVEEGRFAAKAVAGRPVTVQAVIFAEGHDKLSAQVVWCRAGEGAHQSVALQNLGNDHWQAQFVCEQPAKVEFYVEAWLDTYLTYCDELDKKFTA